MNTDKIKRYVKRSPVNATFLVIIVIYFIIMTLNGGTNNVETLIKFGAFFPPFIAEFNQYYRYVTSIFIHIGIMHLFFNAYALYIFGTQIERFMGHKKYLLFFLITGIGGNIATYIFNFVSVSAGASGSLFGLLGAFFYLIIYHKDVLSAQGKSSILRLLVLNLIITVMVPNISVTAHFGGFIIGFLASYIFIK